VNSPPPKPEVILTNFFAEPTVLLVPIMVIRKSCHDINNEFNGFFNRPLKMFDQE
jgi:hypothetical protein